MSIYEHRADLTARQPAIGAGSDMRLLYLCGTARNPHKGNRTGGKFKGNTPMLCPACNTAKEQK
jgi:hypothetical protein